MSSATPLRFQYTACNITDTNQHNHDELIHNTVWVNVKTGFMQHVKYLEGIDFDFLYEKFVDYQCGGLKICERCKRPCHIPTLTHLLFVTESFPITSFLDKYE
ncbi:Hypothetical predicted protein [Octopus vulgaris]|uniref:Uncharacterized protein n=1 Tax=Octopus vulgaris TaxID=6645 RepID=A0AA36AL18_OCTVU|nr:Hypothetical predicted protein [Octopus vulgaris]